MNYETHWLIYNSPVHLTYSVKMWIESEITSLAAFFLLIFAVDRKKKQTEPVDNMMELLLYFDPRRRLPKNLSRHLAFSLYITQNSHVCLKSAVTPFSLPLSQTRWEKWNYCCRTKPSAPLFSGYNGLHPSPSLHPLQLRAIPCSLIFPLWSCEAEPGCS